MRYLIFSDIHGSYGCLEEVLKAFDLHHCDYMIILGDILYHGPRNPLPANHNPKEVAATLNKLASKIICVAGNCEAPVDQMVLEFPCLAETSIIVDEGVRMLATHGHIYNPSNLLSGFDIFLYGHTHLYELRYMNDILICNPGSISLPKENRPQSYAIYADREITIYDFNHTVLTSQTLKNAHQN
ncbi:MAG: YfcE family phosphodiesterase [Epulopiscium sp. Nele67-Bin001]|nr:MAG: YfcE family phosphodiesterase [Epulopiscium sp. Nele67-Bin001]